MAQVVLAVFWFLTGIAYVGIGVYNWTKAKSIRTIKDLPPLEKYFVPPPEEPDLNKPPLHTAVAQKRQPSWGNFFYDPESFKQDLKDLNDVFDSIKKIASEFNKSATTNRGVLRFAAGSFFLAAIISFVQGVSSVFS